MLLPGPPVGRAFLRGAGARLGLFSPVSAAASARRRVLWIKGCAAVTHSDPACQRDNSSVIRGVKVSQELGSVRSDPNRSPRLTPATGRNGCWVHTTPDRRRCTSVPFQTVTRHRQGSLLPGCAHPGGICNWPNASSRTPSHAGSTGEVVVDPASRRLSPGPSCAPAPAA